MDTQQPDATSGSRPQPRVDDDLGVAVRTLELVDRRGSLGCVTHNAGEQLMPFLATEPRACRAGVVSYVGCVADEVVRGASVVLDTSGACRLVSKDRSIDLAERPSRLADNAMWIVSWSAGAATAVLEPAWAAMHSDAIRKTVRPGGDTRKRRKRYVDAPPKPERRRTDETIDSVVRRLLADLGVQPKHLARVTAAVAELAAEHPGLTPARLIELARASGQAIPSARCLHGVRRVDCTVCDPTLGDRYYVTAGGTHVHTRPDCRALAAGQDKVEARGGSTEPIEVLRGGYDVGRNPCRTCFRQPLVRPVPGVAASPAAVLRNRTGFTVLDRNEPPPTGTSVSAGGVRGRVASCDAGGVILALDGGGTLRVRWGERARLG
jgi:hypothetical protein